MGGCIAIRRPIDAQMPSNAPAALQDRRLGVRWHHPMCQCAGRGDRGVGVFDLVEDPLPESETVESPVVEPVCDENDLAEEVKSLPEKSKPVDSETSRQIATSRHHPAFRHWRQAPSTDRPSPSVPLCSGRCGAGSRRSAQDACRYACLPPVNKSLSIAVVRYTTGQDAHQ